LTLTLKVPSSHDTDTDSRTQSLELGARGEPGESSRKKSSKTLGSDGAVGGLNLSLCLCELDVFFDSLELKQSVAISCPQLQ